MMNLFSVTIDVEDWYHVPAVCGSSFSKYKDPEDFFSKWGREFDYLSKPTYRTLDLLDELGVKATFFIVADVLLRYPDLVSRIKRKGHEIACHGYDHRCYIDSTTRKLLYPKSFFKERMQMAKSLLEKAAGKSVTGFRAPAGYVTGWMLDVVENLGFEYDSSVSANSLYNKTDSSLDGVKRNPYYPKSGELTPGSKRTLMELPFSYLKVGPFRIPSAGGPFLRFLGSRFILAGLRQTMREGPTFLYFHPIDISRKRFPNTFSKNRPGYWSIMGEPVEKKIRHILTSISQDIVPMKQLVNTIKKHELEIYT